MKKILSILATAASICISCSQNEKSNSRFSEKQIAQLELNGTRILNVLNENSVKINLSDFMTDKEVSIDKLIDSIHYIPLETTKESLISGIGKLICVDHHIFILDDNNKNVSIFSDDGTFIHALPIGQGPREIFRPQDIAVDTEQEHLIVNCKNGLFFYDYQGEFVKKESLPFYFRKFRVIPNGYLFISAPGIYDIQLGDFSGMQLLITDKNFRIISAGFPFHHVAALNYVTKDNANSFGKEVNFAFSFSDKIYRYVDTLSVREKFQLDFGRKGLPNRYLEKGWNEVYETLKSNDYYFFMGDYTENETHESFQILNFSKDMHRTLIFRDKTSGKMTGGNFVSDGKTLIFSAPFTTYKDEFIGALDGYSIYRTLSELKKDKQRQTTYNRMYDLFGHLTEDANPVLVRYRLKNIN